MIRKSFTCHPTALVALSLALLVALGGAGCGSSRGYDKPAAATTSAGSQINESAQGLTVDALVEYGYSFPHRYNSQGSGQLAVGARNIEWRSEHRKRDFSIQADVLKTATLQCASRPGQNCRSCQWQGRLRCRQAGSPKCREDLKWLPFTRCDLPRFK